MDGNELIAAIFAVIHYKYGTITVPRRISRKHDRIKPFRGPQIKSSASGGRGTNLSRWVFLRAKNKLWVNGSKSRYQAFNFERDIELLTRPPINSGLLERKTHTPTHERVKRKEKGRKM